MLTDRQTDRQTDIANSQTGIAKAIRPTKTAAKLEISRAKGNPDGRTDGRTKQFLYLPLCARREIKNQGLRWSVGGLGDRPDPGELQDPRSPIFPLGWSRRLFEHLAQVFHEMAGQA